MVRRRAGIGRRTRALKHGRYTRMAIEKRQRLRAVLRESLRTIQESSRLRSARGASPGSRVLAPLALSESARLRAKPDTGSPKAPASSPPPPAPAGAFLLVLAPFQVSGPF
jgi:hypothetical protein